MKLKSIEIRSYRSCVRTKLPLHPELTTLIGVNSAGKSNILNGLLLLRKICRSGYMPNRESDSSYNISQLNLEVEYHYKRIFLKTEMVYETDERNLDDIRRTKLRWNLREFTGSAKWQEIPIEFISPYGEQYPFFMETKKGPLKLHNYREIYPPEISNLLKRVILFFNSINYYSASQFADPSRCPVSIELEENRPLRRLRQNLGHEKYILDVYQAYKSNAKQFRRYINTVGKAGIGLVEDILFTEVKMPSSSYKVLSGGKVKKIDKNRLLIIPTFIVDGNKLSPNQLSEGTFKTLALLFYVLTDDSKMLLIEEPEVCIHHGLLSSIIALIKTQSKQKQIVISTHSDFVLDHLIPENLVLVTRSPAVGTVSKPLSKAMSRDDYKALRMYLEESGNLGEYWREGGFENGKEN